MITQQLLKGRHIVHDLTSLPEYVYVFGYGSLMFSSGINGRGMSKTYTDGDLTVATLSGFKRSLSVDYLGANFYGIHRDANSTVIGTVFEISKSDLITLCNNENSYPIVNSNKCIYALTDVTNLCSFEAHKILAFTNIYSKPTHLNSATTKWYVSLVWNGIQHYSSRFKELFLLTGGLK